MSDFKFNGKLPKERLGVPGMHQILVGAAFNKPAGEDPIHKFRDTTRREFKCTATLSKKIFWMDGVDGSIDPESSGSFIVVEPDTEHIIIGSSSGRIVFEKNSRNELCMLRQTVNASGVHDARNQFINNITPYLDFLSFKAGIPILIEKYHVQDTLHLLFAFDNIAPYSPVSIDEHFVNLMNHEMLSIYALYREAKNNQSPYYRFLCHYKIFEAIYKKLRPELNRKAKLKGIKLSQKKEVVPDHPELKQWLPQFVGRSIPDLFYKELTKDYRNQVAHFLLDDGDFLNVSNNRIRGKYDQIILLTELCVLDVIANQDRWYHEFHEAISLSQKT